MHIYENTSSYWSSPLIVAHARLCTMPTYKEEWHLFNLVYSIKKVMDTKSEIHNPKHPKLRSLSESISGLALAVKATLLAVKDTTLHG